MTENVEARESLITQIYNRFFKELEKSGHYDKEHLLELRGIANTGQMNNVARVETILSRRKQTE